MLSVSQIAGFLGQLFLQTKLIKQPPILHVNTKPQKLKVAQKCFGWAWLKMDVANLVSGL